MVEFSPLVEDSTDRLSGNKLTPMTAPSQSDVIDRECMTRAIAAAARVRCITSPNPWVGAVVRTDDGEIFDGATLEPGQAHAEVVALAAAGRRAEGATLYVTLEPCDHVGRTPPCTEAIIAAGIRRVVVGVMDPDPRVAGSGIERLRSAGVVVDVGVEADKVNVQLAPYLKHRRTGRPWVVLKLAASLDGGTAAPNGTSQWITSPAARADGHRMRAESDAIMVGAGTIRRDDSSLTVRDYRPPVLPESGSVDPLRVVLGVAPEGARVHPCREMSGDLGEILDELGADGIVQLLVEGGAAVAGAFHRAGLVDRYIIYLAPALFGGNDANGLFEGAGAWDIAEVWRGRFVSVERVGDDLRVVLEAAVPEDAEVER